MQGCACPSSENGQHKFRPMMVESIPPLSSSMAEIGVGDGVCDDGSPEGFDADDRTKLILAMTTRRYAITCEACGLVAGGFRGEVKEEDSGAAGQG